MRADEEIKQPPVDGWQDFLQRLAHGVRRVALAHPKAFPLVASRPPEAPWLRPPLRSLDWVEAFLRGLTDEGFTDEAAVAAYRAFTSFLLGPPAARGLDARRRRRPPRRARAAEHDPTALDPFPRSCAACARRCPTTVRGRSSRSPSRSCSTGWHWSARDEQA